MGQSVLGGKQMSFKQSQRELAKKRAHARALMTGEDWYAVYLRARKEADGWGTHEKADICLDHVGLPKEYLEVRSRRPKSTPKNAMQEIRTYLFKGLANLRHCTICGGILPELVLHYRGNEYYFACYEIVNEKDQVTAKTDYEQLAKWCKNHYGARSKTAKQKSVKRQFEYSKKQRMLLKRESRMNLDAHPNPLWRNCR